MFIFNIWKHHLKESKNILKVYSTKQVPLQKILKIFNKLGKNQFDIYLGNLRIQEILEDFKTSKKFKVKDIDFFICKDQSLWIYKNIYKNYIHIFPARKSIFYKFKNINTDLHIRLHSNTHQTLLLCYWLQLNDSNNTDPKILIHKARKILKLPQIQFDKSKTLEIYNQLFISS